MNKVVIALNNFVGFSSNKTSHREKLISGLGGFIGILMILVITRQFVGAGDAGLIVASMGASAVLVFAVPHGPLSQPWALGCGQILSAFIGVSCYLAIPNIFVAAASSVGLAITAMYYSRCIHPPGGATALTAVMAGPGVHALGYQYILKPVLINVVVIFIVALIFNYLFSWRRYPASLMHYKQTSIEPDTTDQASLSRDDLEHALQQMNLYVDVSQEDLKQIYYLANNRTTSLLSVDQIKLGHFYSNGEYGNDWSVRQIVDESGDQRPGRDQIIYKIVAGNNRRGSGTMNREAFAAWAKYEVFLNESSWQRVLPATNDTVST